jgi:carbonic anhydrase
LAVVYKDPVQNTREQIKKVRSHPWIAKEVPVRGFVFDLETGLLSEVKERRSKLLRRRKTCYQRSSVM